MTENPNEARMPKGPKYSFEIGRCPPELGTGWRLRYFQDGREIPDADELFPVDEYDTAQMTGELWLEAQPGYRPPRPAPEKRDDGQLGFGWGDDKQRS